ncbi:MAG: hypothetical protein WCG66_02115 [bacterium]
MIANPGITILAMAVFFVLGACAHHPTTRTAPSRPPGILSLQKVFSKSQPRPPVAAAVHWAGTIRLVNKAENFVLVESATSSAVIPGEKYLSIHNRLETGTVLMTSLKSHPFVIADIVAGNPAMGDRIYSPRLDSSEQPPYQVQPARPTRRLEN